MSLFDKEYTVFSILFYLKTRSTAWYFLKFDYDYWFKVSSLVITEAVPKKILDLMNVDGLTRENVASHLQV